MTTRGSDPNLNPRLRNKGNPHTRADHREAGRAGIGKDDVVPAQMKAVPSPRSFGARYRLGAPLRPSTIRFDNGFLDRFKPRAPTASDHLALAKWQAKLVAAQQLRPDLIDGTRAYDHFLTGNGRDLIFDYNRYVLNDNSGRITLANAMLDIQDGVEAIHESHVADNFQITGGQISCGDNSLFPYPATENWQKAIGGHVIWLSGNVSITAKNGESWIQLAMTLQAEDRYNFNPGQSDIVTGIPDNDNGIFELTGLANQFTQYSKIQRILKWKYGTLANTGTTNIATPHR